MAFIKSKILHRYLFITLMMLVAMPMFAASKDVTMQVGETQTLYLPSSVTSLNLKAVNFYSNGIQYVQVTSHTNYSVTVKAIKAFSSPIIVRCDYYYFVKNGKYTYETKGYYDFKITVEGETKIQPTSISFPSSVAAVEVGESRQLTPTVLPSNAEYSLTWHISDTSVASISQSGLLIGKSEGYADLKVSADNGVYTMLRIAVSKPSASSVYVSPSSISLDEGETKNLSATVYPSSANQSVTWKSSDTNVATVSTNGKVTAIQEGTCIVTAKTTNGQTGYCNITVNRKTVLPTSVSIPESMELKVGDTYTLEAVILPANAETALSWATSNPDVATVLNGVITANSTGECDITVYTSNSLHATCSIKVETAFPQSISISSDSETITEGESLQLNAEVLPFDSLQDVTWLTSDESVAVVSASGLVTAVSQGTCIISAITANDLRANCNITVSRKIILAEAISIPETLDLQVGETAQIEADVTPADSDVQVKWYSTNEEVATVDNGIVYAAGKGECEIIASVGNGIEDSCHVVVSNVDEPDNPEIISEWSGSYQMTCSKELFREPSYAYPSEFNLVIENRDGEYFITSFLGLDCTSAYPYEGLKLILESTSAAYIDLDHNNDIGYRDTTGGYIEGLLSISPNETFSYHPDPIYLTRKNDNEIEIQDFYLFAFGVNTDFEHEKEAYFFSVRGSKTLSENTGVINSSMDTNSYVEIYNLNGVCIFSGEKHEIPQLKKGVYVFRNHFNSHKILIK